MRRFPRSLFYAASIGSLLATLAGCSQNYSPNVYAAAAAQQANVVDRGVIVGVRAVKISSSGTVGAITGGAAGGVAGAHAGSGPFVSALGAIGGTLLGGLAGSAVEKTTNDVKAYEYIVQEPSGKLLSVTQTDKTPFTIGTHVLVITGKQARIVRDYTKPLPTKEEEAAASTHEPPPTPVQTTPLAAPFVPPPTSPSAPPSTAPLAQAIAPQASPSPLPGAAALPQAIAPKSPPSGPPAAAELPQALAPAGGTGD